jgi:5'-3' exonuclease
MQVHLVDGTYELFRAYFGAPPALGVDGVEIGAARGLLRGMAALLREPECTHIAIAFDHVIESFRNDLFDGYKTGEGLEPELLGQFQLAEDVAAALGITVWPMVEFEADDAIATAAARFAADPRVEQVRLCSPDKDLAQCVRGDRVVLVDRMRGHVIDEAGVREKWGVAPASIPDLLGLVGDRADGIPGIPRWGLKSSAAVLAVYGHVDAIPTSEAQWDLKVRGAKALAENLGAQRDEALLYKQLAVLREDVPLDEDLDDLEWRGARRDLL